MTQPPHVHILLATYDGAPFLDAQLNSYADQSHMNWTLVVSDDGSKDDTLDRVDAFDTRVAQKVVRRDGPGQGVTRNFLSMIATLGDDADYAALSDQDDVWLPAHLSRGIAALVPEVGPALYGAATWVVDAALENRQRSPHFPVPPSFENALLQSIAGGNTMVLNRAGITLARAAAREALAAAVPVTHDWWLYQLFTGAGARVIRDEEPTVLYRQHGNNLFGTNRGLRATLGRAGQAAGGTLRRWSVQNTAALKASRHRLTASNRATLDAFAALHEQPLSKRGAHFDALGLHRQSPRQSAIFRWAAILGKL